MMWSRIGSGPMVTIGFGRNSVISLSRVPRPPHRMKTGISAIFNGTPLPQSGRAAVRPRPRVLSQTRKRRNTGSLVVPCSPAKSRDRLPARAGDFLIGTIIFPVRQAREFPLQVIDSMQVGSRVLAAQRDDFRLPCLIGHRELRVSYRLEARARQSASVTRRLLRAP